MKKTVSFLIFVVLLTGISVLYSFAANAYPESTHPYRSDTEESFFYAFEDTDAEGLFVTFSEDTDLEPLSYRTDAVPGIADGLSFSEFLERMKKGDSLLIYGADETDAVTYYGSSLAGRTIYVRGSEVHITLKTDGSDERYGFRIERIAPSPPADVFYVRYHLAQDTFCDVFYRQEVYKVFYDCTLSADGVSYLFGWSDAPGGQLIWYGGERIDTDRCYDLYPVYKKAEGWICYHCGDDTYYQRQLIGAVFDPYDENSPCFPESYSFAGWSDRENGAVVYAANEKVRDYDRCYDLYPVFYRTQVQEDVLSAVRPLCLELRRSRGIYRHTATKAGSERFAHELAALTDTVNNGHYAALNVVCSDDGATFRDGYALLVCDIYDDQYGDRVLSVIDCDTLEPGTVEIDADHTYAYYNAHGNIEKLRWTDDLPGNAQQGSKITSFFRTFFTRILNLIRSFVEQHFG